MLGMYDNGQSGGVSMSNEIVAGTVQGVEPRRSKRGYCMFDQVVIEESGGKQRAINKACAAGEVAAAIRRGGKGKFYVSSYGGQTGINGVRLDDGTKAYAHYNNVEVMLIIGIVIGLGFAILGLAGMEGFMITPVVIGVIFLGMYFYMRSNRLAAQKLYDEDR
jgi:hypothetical protein